MIRTLPLTISFILLLFFTLLLSTIVFAAPSVTLTSPTAGECVVAGSTYQVSWSKNSEVDHVAISYDASGNEAHGWNIGHPVSTSPASWTVPSSATETAQVTLDGHNPSHSTLATQTSGLFSIRSECAAPSQPGTPSTTSPTNDNTPTWTWGASTDNVGVDHYEVYWSQTLGGTSNSANTSSSSFTHTTVLADGTWYIKVRAVDAAGNKSSFSSNGSAVIDTTPPSPAPGTPSTDTPTTDKTPTWIWSASASGLDHYEVYWSQTSGGEDFTANTATTASFTHSIELTDGTWFFKVKAFDSLGNSITSSNGQVLIDTQGPTAPANLRTTSLFHNKVDLAWDASSDSGSGLKEYKIFRDGQLKSTQTTASYSDTAVSASTTYTYEVKAYDNVGNASSPASMQVTTSAPPPVPDTTPPNVSQVAVGSISETSAVVAWTTDESATSQVEYGSTVSYGASTSEDTALKTSHSVTLGNLNGGATYHFRVKSKDASGNLAVSADFTFKTKSPPDKNPPIVSNVSSVLNEEDGSVTISWTTDEPSTSQVEYGEGESLGSLSQLNTNMVTSHSVKLENIDSGKTYYFRVLSKDAAGNLKTSDIFSFSTNLKEEMEKDETLSSPTFEKLVFNGSELAVKQDEVVSVTGEDKMLIVGKTFPFAKVKIYVFSDPVVYETLANKNGEWMIEILAESFAEGVHTIEVEAETKEGKITSRKKILSFQVLAVSEQDDEKTLRKQGLVAHLRLAFPVALAAVLLAVLVMVVLRKKRIKERIKKLVDKFLYVR